jgi:hypothetical protein
MPSQKGVIMKKLMILTACAVSLGLITGCTIVGIPEEEVVYIEDDCYVDAYVAIPYEVKELISSRVDGYSMPPVSRYGYEIYPVELYDPHNMPSYVSADFNGDGIYDYAYMFSALSWDGGDWFLETKLLIVNSTLYGYALSLELDLGTVSGDRSIPVEEYWGIRLLEPGIHSVSEFYDGIEIEERVFLEDHGIYLASIDPDERSVFSVHGTDVTEILMDMGAVAKKRAETKNSRARRIIRLEKSTLKTTS